MKVRFAKTFVSYLISFAGAIALTVAADVSYGAEYSVHKLSSSCRGARNFAVNTARAHCNSINEDYESAGFSSCGTVLRYRSVIHYYNCNERSSGYTIPSVSGNDCMVGTALALAEQAGQNQCNGVFESSPNQVNIQRGACTGSCAHESYDDCPSHLGSRETVTIVNGFCRTN